MNKNTQPCTTAAVSTTERIFAPFKVVIKGNGPTPC